VTRLLILALGVGLIAFIARQMRTAERERKGKSFDHYDNFGG
jgi:hypothetical protein